MSLLESGEQRYTKATNDDNSNNNSNNPNLCNGWWPSVLHALLRYLQLRLYCRFWQSVLLLRLHFTSLTDSRFCGTKTMTEKRKEKKLRGHLRWGPGLAKLGPNTKRFKRTLICFNTDTQYAHFRGNALYQVFLCVWILFQNASSHSVSNHR